MCKLGLQHRHRLHLGVRGMYCKGRHICELCHPRLSAMVFVFQTIAKVVMGKFGSEPWSEPKLDWTGPYFRFRFGLWSRTGPTVPFEVQQVPSPC